MKIAGIIIGIVIYGIVALIMAGIGIAQRRSKRPVTFYSGETPPKTEELTDVEAWNQKHGTMWILYGGILFVSGVIGFLMVDSDWMTVPLCGGVFVPLPFMIGHHDRLKRQYMKKRR